MTTVDTLYRYGNPPTEAVALALANIKEVYGIRRLAFDHQAHTLRVEYDATRLSGPAVTKLVRAAGLDVQEEISLIPPQPIQEASPTAPAA